MAFTNTNSSIYSAVSIFNSLKGYSELSSEKILNIQNSFIAAYNRPNPVEKLMMVNCDMTKIRKHHSEEQSNIKNKENLKEFLDSINSPEYSFIGSTDMIAFYLSEQVNFVVDDYWKLFISSAPYLFSVSETEFISVLDFRDIFKIFNVLPPLREMFISRIYFNIAQKKREFTLLMKNLCGNDGYPSMCSEMFIPTLIESINHPENAEKNQIVFNPNLIRMNMNERLCGPNVLKNIVISHFNGTKSEIVSDFSDPEIFSGSDDFFYILDRHGRFFLYSPKNNMNKLLCWPSMYVSEQSFTLPVPVSSNLENEILVCFRVHQKIQPFENPLKNSIIQKHENDSKISEMNKPSIPSEEEIKNELSIKSFDFVSMRNPEDDVDETPVQENQSEVSSDFEIFSNLSEIVPDHSETETEKIDLPEEDEKISNHSETVPALSDIPEDEIEIDDIDLDLPEDQDGITFNVDGIECPTDLMIQI